MNYNIILIIDDSSTSRKIIKRCLEIAGYSESEFIEAQDGITALDLLDRQKVDLIISDLIMPKIDGITLLKKIKLNPAFEKIPVIVITSMGDEKSVEYLHEHNISNFVRKPVSPEKILKALESIYE